MSTRSYWSLWTLLGLVTLGLFVTGNLTFLTVSIIGFVSCLFIFMGMICVTPMLVGPHAEEFQHGDAEPPVKKTVESKPKRLPTTAVVQSRIAH